MSPYLRSILLGSTTAAFIPPISRSLPESISRSLKFSNQHSTMKDQLEAFCHRGPRVEIKRVPIPKPTTPDHLIIKVVVSGSNPKDWKIAERVEGHNQGDDIAGYVHEVGSNVTAFKPGDRVAAFHEMVHPHGSYAEYANAFAYTTWHLPKHTSFEEAATIPLAGMTAALGMYQRLRLPLPWQPSTEEIPLVIYGAASAVGAYAVKMAVLSNIHPLICIAGRGTPYVESLIDKSKGDVVIDYRGGTPAVVDGMKKALGGKQLLHAYDAVSEFGSYQNICKVLDHHKGKITNVLPGKKYAEIPKTVERSTTQVGNVHNKDFPNDVEFGAVFFQWFGRGLEKGFFRGHPYEVIPGGLGGVQQGLQNLKDGKASATKYVFRIAETEGLDSSKL